MIAVGFGLIVLALLIPFTLGAIRSIHLRTKAHPWLLPEEVLFFVLCYAGLLCLIAAVLSVLWRHLP